MRDLLADTDEPPMVGRLRLDLTISDRAPSEPLPPGSMGQDWIGGAIDRESRRMVAEPRRWLRLVDGVESDATGDLAAGIVLVWRLEQIAPGREPSPAGAGGLVLVSMDVDPTVEDEFNDWYTTEHIPLLSQVPGMIRARRFRALSGSPRYVALYHVTDTGIYATDSWTSANHTPWMLRMRRYQRDRTYFMFHPDSGAEP